MNKLRSDVLLNRAMLWLMFSAMAIHYADNKVMAGGYLMMSVFNVVKSMRVWGEDA